MDAVILPFKRPSHAAPCQPVHTLRTRLLDIITQTLMQDYAASPWPVIQDAIVRAGEALNNGESFFEAVEAGEHVILAHHRADNRTLVDAITRQRQRRHAALFYQAAGMIRERLKNYPLDTHYALSRARRVIEGGGTLDAALRFALGGDLEGDSA